MARKNESILVVLAVLPWWVSVIIAGIVYSSLQFYFPSIESKSLLVKALGQIGPKAAPVAALFFLLPGAISLFNSYRKRRLLDEQKDITSIRSLSWKQFEELVGEAYRRQGFTVLENESAGADGGVDLWLKKDGNRYLVQCKQWKSQKVGVSVVREMYGLVSAHHATGAIIITSGTFTQEARTFAHDKNLDLVEGQQLASMIDLVQGHTPSEMKPDIMSKPTIKEKIICPSCGAEMVLRMAKKGGNVGKQFWGCSTYPKCRGVRKVDF
jgi:restriction system protein